MEHHHHHHHRPPTLLDAERRMLSDCGLFASHVAPFAAAARDYERRAQGIVAATDGFLSSVAPPTAWRMAPSAGPDPRESRGGFEEGRRVVGCMLPAAACIFAAVSPTHLFSTTLQPSKKRRGRRPRGRRRDDAVVGARRAGARRSPRREAQGSVQVSWLREGGRGIEG